MDCTFRKEEHLCGKKNIDELFTHGKSFFSYPYVVYWKTSSSADGDIPARLLIVVPKKKLRHAVDRNRTKRLIRECYRLQKSSLHSFLSSRGITASLALIYTEKQPPEFRKLYEKHRHAMKQLTENINKSLNGNENNK